MAKTTWLRADEMDPRVFEGATVSPLRGGRPLTGLDYAAEWPDEIRTIMEHGPVNAEILGVLPPERVTDYFYLATWLLREEGEDAFIAIAVTLGHVLADMLERGERWTVEAIQALAEELS